MKMAPDVEVSSGRTDPSSRLSARIYVDDELVCNLPSILGTQSLRWSGLLCCDVTATSEVSVRLCKSVNNKARYFNYPAYTVSEVDEETGESALELPAAAWVVTVKILNPAIAEQLYPDQLDKFNAIDGAYDSLESYATVKYLFKNALKFASIVAEARPESPAKVSFLIYMKAWELLDQQAQLDDTIRAILRGLIRIRDIVDITSQASSSILVTSIEQAKEPIKGILALLEDVSVYMFDQYTRNDLAHVPAEDMEADNKYDVEAYLGRLEDLQTMFFASWSPATASSTNNIGVVDDEYLDELQQNNQDMTDRPMRAMDPYEMLSLLRPMDPSGYDPRQACMDGTREVVLNKIITWTQNRDSSEGLMWICGQIGMGKTAIATSLCQRLDKARALAGSFFCRRDDPNLNDPLRMINNLVHDIALRCPAYAEQVANAIRANRMLCNSHLDLRYEGLIKKPLEMLKSLPLHTTLAVLVDGFDECGGYESRQQVLKLLYNMSQLVPWLKIIITARPVGDIQECFQDVCPDEPVIHLQNYDASPDISIYIHGKLGQHAEREQWPSNSIEKLCDLAQGVFLWAATTVNYIKKSNFPALPRLQKVLSNRESAVTHSLDALYRGALKTIIDDDEAEIKAVYLRCIGAILATSERDPLSIPDLQYLLLVAKDLDQLTLELVIRNLAPLLLETDGKRLGIHHTSFRDFVTNPMRSGEYHIQLDKYEADPTACCLDLMQRDLRFNICKLETSHLLNSEVSDLRHRIQSNIGPALKYACIHWVDHFVSSPNQALVGVLKQFMEGPQMMYWIEVLSFLGRLDVAVTGLSKLGSLELTKFNFWNLIASWASDAHRFVLTFYNTIASSTPHLYISALAFSPDKSLTAQRMRPYFPNTITIPSGAGSGWHPCVKVITHQQAAQSLSLSPDGSRVILGYSDGSLDMWDLQTGARIGEVLVGHKDSVACVVVSSNGYHVASGSFDTTVRVWDTSGDLKSSKVLVGHSGPVHTVAFSPDSTILASGSSDKTIQLWDTRGTRQYMYGQ
ncbi:unnamed protein product [Rhizoctonia solani]|uniref:Nephrocystin 3-like N-terminal domain-containing protein n=1 Tax=Rhizoctonia solani TaxID=456999 RepID=A0A8H3GK47_9AGAM|nr:unnamed protein product [Rhizoctonia solani]